MGFLLLVLVLPELQSMALVRALPRRPWRVLKVPTGAMILALRVGDYIIVGRHTYSGLLFWSVEPEAGARWQPWGVNLPRQQSGPQPPFQVIIR